MARPEVTTVPPVIDVVVETGNRIPSEISGASPRRPPGRVRQVLQARWWLPNLALAVVAAVALVVGMVTGQIRLLEVGTGRWWLVVAVVHLPFLAIVVFLFSGLIERLGYFRRGRALNLPGQMPSTLPTVCVQLPMFNEDAVARRSIEAACALDWPRDRLEIQVLDDSTDAEARAVVDEVCDEMQARGMNCRVLRRDDRTGYKAGALEVGRRETSAQLIVIFDADFLPPNDFLRRAVGYFFDGGGRWIDDLALVQAQWGHLNHDESMLTRAQSLWVDDHHTVQMSWRSEQWGFVNFTGTAGVWRADAIERAGGWRAASLVEDCELSFRHLFAGYRTRFVKEVVAPAELPATYTAYKAQQKRWTQGWVQLQRLHLRTLLRDYRTTPLRRLHLLYHMCIPWQWALWGLWLLVLPVAMWNGLWLGMADSSLAVAAYVAPVVVWLAVSAAIATLETRSTYPGPRTRRVLLGRFARVIPYAVLNAGMLPHQVSAFSEGLFGSMHSEFERTPKAATVTTGADTAGRPAAASAPVATTGVVRRASRPKVRVHRPYVAAETFFAVYQLAWAAMFFASGLRTSALTAAFVGSAVIGLMWFYGDHADRRLFVIPVRGAHL
jgi:cellulose synthase/poly-beta-1,6-N-acetylglucosamine synthase-like glycosyltransferase